MTINRQDLVKKWNAVLGSDDAPKIRDSYRNEVTAVLLENTQNEMAKHQSLLNEAAPTNSTGGYPDAGGVAKYDPVLISLVRRSAPQMIAFDICGVQPMTQPTGLIFAMKSRYTAQNGAEALFNEADTDFSGTGAHPNGVAMSTTAGERLGQKGSGDGDFGQMAFSIEKTAVEAKTRALKAEYSLELAQDMRALHGIDAEAELSNILSTEIIAEINREVVRKVYSGARVGAQDNTAVAGTFNLDVDSNGRWSVERFKGLMFQIEREANMIAKQTRRGRGNFLIVTADVASALAMAGVLDYNPALQGNAGMNIDESSSTFAGVLNGKYKVFIDPYASNTAAEQFVTVGYKGQSSFDAGLFYCPYVPLQMVRATDSNSFQPKIGFKTRYGMVSHPMVQLDGTGNMVAGENYYYRKFSVTNLM